MSQVPPPAPEPDPDEEPQRPFPDPERDITPRKPRTPGGVVYLLVLVATLLGVALVALGGWRAGLATSGVALGVGAAVRLVLHEDAAGMLKVRRKLIDVLTLLALSAGLVLLALAIPDQPAP